MSATTLLTAGVMVTIAALSAEAQVRPAQTKPRPVRPFVERGFIAFNGAAAMASDLSDQRTFQSNAELGSIDAQYPGKAAFLAEAGAGLRVRRRIGVALTVSHGTGSGNVTVNAEVPHPFFDDRDRSVSGEAAGISRSETAAHAQLYYEMPKGRWRVRFSAGPSYFHIERELVVDVQTVETFPFDTAEFRGATTARATGSGIGFNVGVDTSRMFTRRIGAGVLVRYAGASLDLSAPGAPRVSSDGGGLQAGAGIRILF